MTGKEPIVETIIDRWTVPIYPLATGRILQWYAENATRVNEGERLYRFDYYPIPLTRDVPSPATGILYILVEADAETYISITTKIAEIKKDVPV
ncbi:MAG TPA: hypothetical protein ACFYD1_07735 [Candidatus Hypogeohydataceae bacterium YC38]|nr:hypothetical protein [Candidatus Brocadiales bacterium]